ncbi:MAG: TssQ family T6SS-associated lipoprotein [Burkholderiaceae bacterium]
MKLTLTCLLSLSLLLAGCGTGGGAPRAGSQSPATPEQQAALQALRTTYGNGRYGDVIREVARSDVLASAPRAVVVESMKLQAFSYCLTGHPSLCQDQFARILVLEPGFTLQGAEQGHPQWQRAFDQARARTATQ